MIYEVVRIMGSILALVASSAVGFIYADNFKKRVIQLNEVLRSIYQLQNEIVYTHTPLPDAFSNVSQKSKEPLSLIFEDISKQLMFNAVESVNEAFNKSINSKTTYLNLKEEDISILLDLAKSLGESDIEGQRSIFSLTLENLKKQVNEASEIMNKSVKMYRYLGISLGAAIVILLI